MDGWMENGKNKWTQGLMGERRRGDGEKLEVGGGPAPLTPQALEPDGAHVPAL